MLDILGKYEEASRQAINLAKSEVYFSANVDNGMRLSLSNLFGVSEGLGSRKYLGLPFVVGRKKMSFFNFIKDKVWRKINSWNGGLFLRLAERFC